MSIELGLEGRTAVITGGAGAICGAIAAGLAGQGVNVCIWDISRERAANAVKTLREKGGRASCFTCDATDTASIQKATQETMSEFGAIDMLVNGAGGSLKDATTSPELPFFNLSSDAMGKGFALNYFSSILVCQSIGRVFAECKKGVILNITSIAGISPLSQAVTYSDAKAASNSFTRWLAVHMATTYSPKIRVNALAPGFILTDQNRFLLYDEETGSLTPRGRTILTSVPMARLGKPEEITGAALWLLSDYSGFVTGAVVPIDGGFTANSGV